MCLPEQKSPEQGVPVQALRRFPIEVLIVAAGAVKGLLKLPGQHTHT
jgi:hypothetical protein